MAKNKNDYFKLIEQQITYSVEASDLLDKIICNYNPKEIITYRDEIHEIEHAGDKLHHDILARLFVEFITPIDQEDILRLVQIIDDITDALDEIVLEFYMFHIEQMLEAAPALSKVVNRCVKALLEAAKELRNFKKPTTLHSLLVKINDIESECDSIYIEAIHDLFGSNIDEKTLHSNRIIYESLEKCCDLCELAADIIEQIIIKNT